MIDHVTGLVGDGGGVEEGEDEEEDIVVEQCFTKEVLVDDDA